MSSDKVSMNIKTNTLLSLINKLLSFKIIHVDNISDLCKYPKLAE